MKKLVAVALMGIISVSSIGFCFGSGTIGYGKTNIGVVIKGKSVAFERSVTIKNGRILIPARTALNYMGARIEWYEKIGKIEIVSNNKNIIMYNNSKIAYIGNEAIDMGVEPYCQKGTVMIPLRFVMENLGMKVSYSKDNSTVLISSSENSSRSLVNDRKDTIKNFSSFRVVIDPGHGGADTGARAQGIYEKNLNLDIAKRLNTLLKAKGVATYMTRTTDKYVSLYQRSGLANSVDADLFISIHNNAQEQRKVSGSMSLYYPTGSTKKGNLSGYELASIVQNKLSGSLNTNDLGIYKRPNLAVLRTSKMPAVLAEIGYMTNSAELRKLKTQDFRDKAAKALEEAIIEALLKI